MYPITDIFYKDDMGFLSQYFYNKHFLKNENLQHDEVCEMVVRPFDYRYLTRCDMDMNIQECPHNDKIHSYQLEGTAPNRVLTITMDVFTFTYDEGKRTLTIEADEKLAPILKIPKEDLRNTEKCEDLMFPEVHSLTEILAMRHRNYIHPYLRLVEHLGTERAKEDEAVFLAVTDRVYQWFVKNLPNYHEIFESQCMVSLGYFGDSSILLFTPENLEPEKQRVYVEHTFEKSDWKAGVDDFLYEFTVKLCEELGRQKNYAAEIYRISEDLVEGRLNYQKDLKELNISLAQIDKTRYMKAIMAKALGEVWRPTDEIEGKWKVSQWCFKGIAMPFEKIVQDAQQLYGADNVIVSENFPEDKKKRVLSVNLKTFAAFYCEEPPYLTLTAHEHTSKLLKMTNPTVEGKDKKKTHNLDFNFLNRLDASLNDLIHQEAELQSKIVHDPWFDAYANMIRTIASDAAPFIGAKSPDEIPWKLFTISVSIPQEAVLVVNIWREEYDLNLDRHKSIELHLDEPGYMDAWHAFYSLWRMETIKETKLTYQKACANYEAAMKAKEAFG